MTVTRDQVAELYVATFNRAPLADGLDYWTSSDFTIEMIAQCFFEQTEAQAIYTDGGEDIPSQQFVLRIFENLFNRLPQTEGLEYWMDALDSGAVSRDEMILAVINGATGDDAVMLANKTEAAIYYADQGGTDTDYPLDDIDETEESLANALAAIDSALAEDIDFTLSASTDDLVGTSSDDVFEAPIVQNFWAGGVSNSLSTADSIDGGAGTDTLQVELVPEFYGVSGTEVMEVQPDIQSVEDIRFEAMDVANVAVITVDAKDITDVVEIGSSYSDADLVIENLTTLTASGAIRNTEEITVVMDHTDNSDTDGDASDLTVLFDEDYLVSGQTSQASAYYFLLDEDAELNGLDDRLNRINVDGLRFTLGDPAGDIIEISDPEAQTSGTHEAFVEALQDELQALIDDGTLPEGSTLTLDYTITDDTGLDDGSISDPIPAIVLTTGDGTTVTPVGYSQVEDVVGNYDVYGQFYGESETANNPVTVNVVLEKVGRDGEGGNLVIGGKDNDIDGDSDVDQVDGIAVFNIAVNGTNDQPSNLGTVSSTNQALDTVYISNGDDWDGAELTIRDVIGGGQELTLIDATDFDGDFSLAMSAVTSQQALTSQFGSGDDSYDWISVEADDVSSDKDYRISMGSGDDSVTATLDGDSVDALGESFTLDSGSGDDVVAVISGAGVSQETMFILDNMSIDTGSGADRVTINGYQRFDIETGSDDDYVEITSLAPLDGSNGVWNVGAETGVQPFVERVLYNAQLTVSFAGFESTVTVETNAAGNFIADQTTINAAIIAAIEQSDVLTELLRDYDDVVAGLDYDLGTGNQALQIISDFDGANELAIDLYQPTLVDADADEGETVLSSSDLAAIRQGIINTTNLTSDDLENEDEIIAEFNDGTTANLGDGSLDATGDDISTDQFDYQFMPDNTGDTTVSADATAEVNYSVINTGSGDDIVVLHSNDDSANTLVFDSEFGTLAVVNFFDDAERTVTGNHILDFTYYLDNQQDPSDDPDGNTQSVVDIGITYDGPETAVDGDDLVGNEVTVVKPDFDDDDTFEGLTASNFLAAINGDDGTLDYADIDDETLDAADSPFGEDFVGTVQDHIVLVENSENPGEYKVFYLTSELDADGAVDNADGDFASSVLLGTIDFGASITEDPISMANLLNSADPAGDGGATSWDDFYLDDVLAGEVVDPNTAPVVEENQTFAVDENSAGGTVVGTVAASDADGDTLTYAIPPTVTEFEINSATGVITVADGAVLDYETTDSYTIEVRVTDPDGAFDTATLTVDINDVAEGENTAPVVEEDQIFTVDENSAGGTVVGTVAASDADGDTLTYAVPPTVTEFEIDSETGVITVADGAVLDYETTDTYTIAVRVTDPDGAFDTATLTVNINDVNEGGYTEQSADIGTATAAETLDAGTDSFKFTDDATVLNNVEISNFTEDDVIEVTNADEANYSFSNNGEDVAISFNNAGTLNQIVLTGVVSATDLVYDQASFEAAIGFDAFTVA